MAQLIDFTEKRFGRLVAIKQVAKNTSGHQMWLCKCDCGRETIVDYHNLKNNHTKSCGCLQRESTANSNTTHGLRKTRLYRTWHHMRERCYYPKDKRYANYGGRGIAVCDEWNKDFQAFYEWAMANGYREDLSIDRIDVNGNYEPSNCRWATTEEQANNRQSNRRITIGGETLTLSEWSKRSNIKRATFYARIKKGWSEEKALFTPVRR